MNGVGGHLREPKSRLARQIRLYTWPAVLRTDDVYDTSRRQRKPSTTSIGWSMANFEGDRLFEGTHCSESGTFTPYEHPNASSKAHTNRHLPFLGFRESQLTCTFVLYIQIISRRIMYFDTLFPVSIHCAVQRFQSSRSPDMLILT
jgi:hypothetical protein